MKKTSFSALITAMVLTLIVLFIPNKWLVPLLDHDKLEQAATDLDPDMFEGMIVQSEMLKDNSFLPIYGSSELSRLDNFHPSSYFLTNPKGFTPFLVGRGGSAAMYHFLNFSVQKDNLKGKKLVFILSPQWFTKKGEDERHFGSNFSELQAYQFALNPKIDARLVKRGSERMLSYEVVKSDPLLTSLLKLNLKDGKQNPFYTSLLKGTGHLYFKLLEKRDLLISLFDIPTKKPNPNPSLTRDKSWDELNKIAHKTAKNKFTTNKFYITDSYYNHMIKSKVSSLKNYKSKESFSTSPEYQDFQMVLDVLKESGAKPLFISVPVNGYWYDYTGFNKENRIQYYTKIKHQITNEGFPVVDLSKYEYNKYFLTDTMHLGYKGWVKVDKEIVDFVKSKNKIKNRSH